MRKFKVGQKVKIIKCEGGHCFKHREIVTVTGINEDSDIEHCASSDGNIWYLGGHEVEYVTEKDTTVDDVIKLLLENLEFAYRLKFEGPNEDQDLDSLIDGLSEQFG